ncbi:hypothetical protein RRG08_053794 [Elysia crispata]|uniref:Secreted protein n=1 Tax=Elysia crispata TaxID=231223 RepID=A0AAE1DDA6_9GAST|nr:hypothetical protein RRG08_053794 [Elysia crispata]
MYFSRWHLFLLTITIADHLFDVYGNRNILGDQHVTGVQGVLAITGSDNKVSRFPLYLQHFFHFRSAILRDFPGLTGHD